MRSPSISGWTVRTLIITVPALFVVGVTVEWLFMRRLADRDRTAMSILVTYAVAILIEGIITQIFGVSYVQLHASYVDKSIHVFGFYLPYIYLYGFALAIVLLGLLYAADLSDSVRPVLTRCASGPRRRPS